MGKFADLKKNICAEVSKTSICPTPGICSVSGETVAPVGAVQSVGVFPGTVVGVGRVVAGVIVGITGLVTVGSLGISKPPCFCEPR